MRSRMMYVVINMYNMAFVYPGPWNNWMDPSEVLVCKSDLRCRVWQQCLAGQEMHRRAE